MKKITGFLSIALVLFMASCKKDSTATVDAGSWQLGTNTYKVGYSTKGTTSGGTPTTLYIFSDVVITGPSTTANTLNFTFLTPPTASGTYQMVSAGSSSITSTQMQVSAGNSSATYAYIGSPVNVDVTVSGGKVKIVVPSISMTSTTGGAAVNLTASVQEQ